MMLTSLHWRTSPRNVGFIADMDVDEAEARGVLANIGFHNVNLEEEEDMMIPGAAGGDGGDAAAGSCAIASELALRANLKWGVFTFTGNAPIRKARFGEWQVLCPYHNKSCVTQCTKHIALRSPDFESEELVLAALKSWAVTSTQYTYAWQHADEPTILEVLPPLDGLLPQLEDRMAAHYKSPPYVFLCAYGHGADCLAPALGARRIVPAGHVI